MTDKVKQIQWFDQHHYKIGENYIASVTTKLGADPKTNWALARWRGTLGNREADLYAKERADIGSRIHHAWCVMTTGGVVLYNPYHFENYTTEQIESIYKEYGGNVIVLTDQYEMWNVYKLQLWHKELKPEIIYSEAIVYSEKLNEAGQVDKKIRIEEGEYEINGSKKVKLPAGNYIVDLKTGKNIDTAFMQLAAYVKCDEELTGETITGAIIVHTGATTRSGIVGLATKVKLREELKEDWLDYRAVAHAWERRGMNQTPKIFSFPSIIQLDK
ncbi:MAG: hypothetical protein ACUZ8E_07105 [Candidatus Anammoxibacter sp.]